MNSKLYCLILLTILLTFSSSAQTPAWLWANSIGSTLNEKGQSVTTDANGNTYTTGSFQGTVDFDPGATAYYRTSAGDLDIYIVKLNAAGNFVWVKQMGGINTDEGMSITSDAAGNVYVAGHFQSTADFDPGIDTFALVSFGNYDIFVAKYDSSGNLIWVKQMGGTSIDDALSIAIDAVGNVYTTGYFGQTADFDPDSILTANMVSMGGQDIFVSKLDSSGNFVWAKAIGSPSGDKGQGIAVDNAGNVYTTGYFVQTADFDPGSGVYNLTSNGSGDIFICKLDSSGNFSWACGLGKTTTDKGNSIAVDASGVYSTGTFAGTVDFDPDAGNSFSLSSGGTSAAYILKLTNAGIFDWAKAITTVASNTALGQSLVIDPVTRNISLGGSFTVAANFDPGITDLTLAAIGNDDVFVTSFDSSGNFLWAKDIGGTNTDLCGAISLSPTGFLSITGTYFSPAIAFDSTITITNSVGTGIPDIFIARLDNTIGTIIVCNPGFNYSYYLFPVPASNHLTLSIPDNKDMVDVKITDMSGKVVYENAFTSTELEILTEQLSNGIYILNLKTTVFEATRSFVIKK